MSAKRTNQTAPLANARKVLPIAASSYANPLALPEVHLRLVEEYENNANFAGRRECTKAGKSCVAT